MSKLARDLDKVNAHVSAAHDHIQMLDVGATDTHAVEALQDLLNAIQMLKIIVTSLVRAHSAAEQAQINLENDAVSELP